MTQLILACALLFISSYEHPWLPLWIIFALILVSSAIENTTKCSQTDSSKVGMGKASSVSVAAAGVYLEELLEAFQPIPISMINIKDTLTLSSFSDILHGPEPAGEHLEELCNAFQPLSSYIGCLANSLTFSSSSATRHPLTHKADQHTVPTSGKIIDRTRPFGSKAFTKPNTGLPTPPETPSEHSLAEEDVSETSMADEDNTKRPPTPSSSTEADQLKEDGVLIPSAADEAILTAAIDTVLDEELTTTFDQESQPSEELEAAEKASNDDCMQVVHRRRLVKQRDLSRKRDVQSSGKAAVVTPEDQEELLGNDLLSVPSRRNRRTVDDGAPLHFSGPCTDDELSQWAEENGLDGAIPRGEKFQGPDWRESTRDRDLEGAKEHIMVWTEWGHREHFRLIPKPNAQLIFSDPEVLEEVSDKASKHFLDKFPDAWEVPAHQYDANGDEDSEEDEGSQENEYSEQDGDLEQDESSEEDRSFEQEGSSEQGESFERFGSSEQEGSSKQDGYSGGSGTSPPSESNASPSIGSKPGHQASQGRTEPAPISNRAAIEAPSKKPAKQSRFAAFFAQQEADKKSSEAERNELDSALRGYDEPLTTATGSGEAPLPPSESDQDIQYDRKTLFPEWTQGYNQEMVRWKNPVWWEQKAEQVRLEFRDKLPSTLAEEVRYRQFLGYQSTNEFGSMDLVANIKGSDPSLDKSGWYPSTNITPYYQTAPYRRFLFDPRPHGADTPDQVPHEWHPVLVARHQVMGRRFCKAPEAVCYARHFVERKPQFDDGMNKARRFWVHMDARPPKDLDFSQKAIDAMEAGPSSPVVKKEDDNYGSMGFDPSIVDSPSLMGKWSETVPRRHQHLRTNTRNRQLLSKALRRRQPLSRVSERQLAALQALHDSMGKEEEMEQEEVEQEEVKQEEVKQEKLTVRRPHQFLKKPTRDRQLLSKTLRRLPLGKISERQFAALQARHDPKEEKEQMRQEAKARRISQTAAIRDRLWKGYAAWQDAGSRPPLPTLANPKLGPAPTADYLPPGFRAQHDPFAPRV
ncbi:hypothetical protein W97_06873 [Coniosporium apollinis CBS 100218]|uniref:Uncharacterized protein n=1 Tax=Coniosporium apollinis (strain CBS 100218) TaxID=1168221 RepID=R7YZX8_CONA1|nr:uncharacterized protein W97_06873 [Coniosporium apollinis CBS 100218]EON67505.1 hypothetical protein W97_06873 [Coniosporium apollinis CBS 100218]